MKRVGDGDCGDTDGQGGEAQELGLYLSPWDLHPAGQEELQMLFFSETLAMVSNTGEPQGELTIDVQTGKHRDDTGALSNCLLVHAFSRGFMDKMLCGNSLLGRVPAA